VGPATPGGKPDLPDIPGPVAVSCVPAHSALVVCDLSDVLCGPYEGCRAVASGVAPFLERAREAGVAVIHTLGRAPQVPLAEVAPRPGEPFVSSGADKFFRTELEHHLTGVRTALFVGHSANGSILYSAFAACARGMAVAVVEDLLWAHEPFGLYLTRWQLLNQPGYRNVVNAPLAASAVTLTRSDLVTFAG